MLLSRAGPFPHSPAAPKPKKKKKKEQQRTAVDVDENYKPTEVVEPLWHPSGCDLCSRPLMFGLVDRAVVIGWLPAAERFLVDGKCAALYKVAYTTGHSIGVTVDLEEEEVRKCRTWEALPSAEDYEAAAVAAVGIRWTTESAGGAGAGEDALVNDSQPIHALLQPEAVSPPTCENLLGRWIEVYWAGDKVWYLGRVVSKKTIIGGSVQLSVKYDDGDEYDEELQNEPFAGEGVPPDDRKPWYWRFAEPPSSKKRSLPDTSHLCDAKKQKTDVDGEVEFEIEENQNHAKILSLLKEKQEMEIEASRRGL